MTTKRLAVVGSPITHSKSPAIHNAAYRVLKLDWNYDSHQVERGQLQSWLDALDDSWVGVSVTAPLKEEASHFAATALETALGSANTLIRTASGWIAYNTDVFGMTQALQAVPAEDIRRVTVVGAGATAKSALVAISRLYPKAKVTLAARRREPASKLKNFALHALKIEAKTTQDVSKAIGKADLVVSTLPAGALDEYVAKLQKSWFGKPKGALFDVAYEPWPSKAAEAWSAAKLPVISGIDMLIWQAVAQIRLFTGASADQELFNEAAVLHAMRDSVGLL